LIAFGTAGKDRVCDDEGWGDDGDWDDDEDWYGAYISLGTIDAKNRKSTLDQRERMGGVRVRMFLIFSSSSASSSSCSVAALGPLPRDASS